MGLDLQPPPRRARVMQDGSFPPDGPAVVPRKVKADGIEPSRSGMRLDLYPAPRRAVIAQDRRASDDPTGVGREVESDACEYAMLRLELGLPPAALAAVVLQNCSAAPNRPTGALGEIERDSGDRIRKFSAGRRQSGFA